MISLKRVSITLSKDFLRRGVENPLVFTASFRILEELMHAGLNPSAAPQDYPDFYASFLKRGTATNQALRDAFSRAYRIAGALRLPSDRGHTILDLFFYPHKKRAGLFRLEIYFSTSGDVASVYCEKDGAPLTF